MKQQVRKRIHDTKKEPNCWVGYVSAKFQSWEAQSTGVLIGERLVLTAAQNVYDKDQNQKSTEVFFTPAANGQNDPPISVSRFWIPPEYKSKPKGTKDQRQWDFALLYLQESQKGFLKLSQNCREFKEATVSLWGYPFNLRHQIDPSEIEKFQFGASGKAKVDISNRNFIICDIPSSPGQAGSPIIYNGTNGFQLIGIEVQPHQSEDQNSVSSSSAALLITQRIIERICDWGYTNSAKLQGQVNDIQIKAKYNQSINSLEKSVKEQESPKRLKKYHNSEMKIHLSENSQVYVSVNQKSENSQQKIQEMQNSQIRNSFHSFSEASEDYQFD